MVNDGSGGLRLVFSRRSGLLDESIDEGRRYDVGRTESLPVGEVDSNGDFPNGLRPRGMSLEIEQGCDEIMQQFIRNLD